MCDENELTSWDQKLADKGLSRRRFGALTGAVALAACTSEGAGAPAGQVFKGSMVNIKTSEGTMDAYWVRAPSGPAPAIILWPDIASIRASKRQMADRLAAEGYSVLVANPYYRDVPADQFESSVQFREAGGFQTVRPWREKLSSRAVIRDADTLVNWVDQRDAVDTSNGIGTQGYCMGGSFAVYTAHSRPERVKAAASFHGGGLVRDDADSPHKILQAGTNYLIAIAKNDDAKAPDDKTALRSATDGGRIKAEIEVYAGDHGWCVPDNPKYAEAEAERAWRRLLAIYDKALKR